MASQLETIAGEASRIQQSVNGVPHDPVFRSVHDAFNAFLEQAQGRFHISEARAWIYSRCDVDSRTGTLNGKLFKACKSGRIKMVDKRSGFYDVIEQPTEVA